MPKSIKVEVPYGGTVTSIIYPSGGSGSEAVAGGSLVTIILGHGAGADQTSRFMVELAEGLASRGCNAATFNFPYTEHGRKVPDPAQKLEACYKAVIEAVARYPGLTNTGLIFDPNTCPESGCLCCLFRARETLLGPPMSCAL